MVSTEIEHTVMSTLLHLYVYLHVIFFKVAVMSIIGWNSVDYWVSLLINRNRNNCTDLLRYVDLSVLTYWQ